MLWLFLFYTSDQFSKLFFLLVNWCFSRYTYKIHFNIPKSVDSSNVSQRCDVYYSSRVVNFPNSSFSSSIGVFRDTHTKYTLIFKNLSIVLIFPKNVTFTILHDWSIFQTPLPPRQLVFFEKHIQVYTLKFQNQSASQSWKASKQEEPCIVKDTHLTPTRKIVSYKNRFMEIERGP